jgi:type III secretory pathway component EscV
MLRFFQQGYAFFITAVIFILISTVAQRPAVYIILGVVFLILGFVVRKEKSRKSS